MSETSGSFLANLKRPRVLIPTLLVLLLAGGIVSYAILLNPNSIFVRWAQAALPGQITMISMGAYPEEKDFQRFKKEGVKYIVSTLDPRLPYEKQLIDRETILAKKYGMTLKVFPMASIFDRRIFPDYLQQQQEAVEFLKKLDAPAYVHCYLGKHRVIHIRDALIKAGVPKRYWTPTSSKEEYWDLVNRIRYANEEFRNHNFPKTLEILQPITVKDVDVSSLRGWSYYRLGLVSQAMENFRQGLKVEPTNPRNLVGVGYCYLHTGQAVMAQRQFNTILQAFPDEEGALVGQGLAYLALQNKKAAMEVFRKVLAMDPVNNEVKGYLQQAESR